MSPHQAQTTAESPGQRKALHTTGGATRVPHPAVMLPADIQPMEAVPTPAPALPATVSITGAIRDLEHQTHRDHEEG